MRLLFTLLSLLLLVSCTVTKRHSGPGYHVEWKKFYYKTESDVEKEKVVNAKDDCPLESENSTTHQTDSLSYSNSQEEKIALEEGVLDEILISGTIENAETENPSQQIEKTSLPEKEEPEFQIKQRTEPLTWVSLILLFVAGIALGIIAAYGSILFVGAGILITCLMIAMFVCSLISVIRIHRDPIRYKNKGLTYFLFSLSFICLITAALYLIVISALASMTPMLQGI